VGTFLVNGSLLFLLLAGLAVANLHYQILQEEAFLTRLHGPAYEAYRRQTARYLGRRRAGRTKRLAQVARAGQQTAEATRPEEQL
jgi:hypothetical protein